MDRLGTPEIIDLLLVGGILILGALGAWRGVVKETFISGALLLGLVVSQQWTSEWSSRVEDWFNVSGTTAELAVRIAIPIVVSLSIGYVAGVNAGLPPSDAPGRLGGFVVGALNAVMLAAIIGSAIYDLKLNPGDQATVASTRLARALILDFDRVVLAILAVALLLTIASVWIRKRRMAILVPAGGTRVASSGYQIRRDRPLAPEAEKIETGAPSEGHDPLGETVPISRVADSSRVHDRPPPTQTSWRVPTREDEIAASQEVVRCVSCGERLSADDRFCPRCGRSLVR